MDFYNSTINVEFQKTAMETAGKERFFYNDESYTWKEIDNFAMKIAAEIHEQKIERGSRIAIWSCNSPLFVSAFFAILKMGCTAVLINPAYKTFEINQLVDYAELRGIFCDDNTIKKLRNTKNMDFVNYIGEEAVERLQVKEMPSEEIQQEINDIEVLGNARDFACMMFTSGTVGGPKGVELTHFQMLNVADRAVKAMHWNSEDTVCLSLPLFHCFGLSTGLLAALFHRGKVCMNNGFHSADIMKLVEKRKCTVLNGVPTMFLSLLYNPSRKKYDLTSLNSGIIAGSGVYEKDFLTIAREIPIPHLMQSYGQTEASPSITFSKYEDSLEKRAKSTGVAIPDVEIRIRNSATGEILQSGEKGDVEIRGFNTMKGYYRRETETKNVFLEDGWMRTGDIGSLDEQGYLCIYGRKQEMIIRGGENISPHEIEEVILNMKGVRQTKVFGIDAAVIQKEIVACIITDTSYSKEQVKTFIQTYLADYKVPKYICFYDAFPENASGKVDMKALKEESFKRLYQ